MYCVAGLEWCTSSVEEYFFTAAPSKRALSVLFVIYILANVTIPVGEDEHTLSVSFPIRELSFISTSLVENKDSASMRQSITDSALILAFRQRKVNSSHQLEQAEQVVKENTTSCIALCFVAAGIGMKYSFQVVA